MAQTNHTVEKIVVSRKWDNPNIEIFLNTTEVGARIELYKFLDLLILEIGNPTLLLTKTALSNKIQEATNKIVLELKNQTVNL